MKDAYSFHLTEEDFEQYYESMKGVYKKIYQRLGLGDITKLVAASGGDFSEFSHEFQTIHEIGEDEIFYDEVDDVYYNKEIVESLAPPLNDEGEVQKKMESVHGEGLIGVEPLAKFLGIAVEKTTKTLLYETENGRIIAVAVRGKYKIDEAKLKKVVNDNSLRLASEETVKKVTGAKVGYAGMLNLSETVEQYWDESCANRANFEMGANKTDYHNINVNFDVDIPTPENFYNLKVPQSGDLDPKTSKKFLIQKAVEVGNIFPLSTKFSEAFRFKVNGQAVFMGCYGIGISRIMGVLAEIFSDENGLKWPTVVAPFQVYLAAIGRDDKVYTEAEKLYQELTKTGYEVLYDDRRDKKIGPGQKFADHELLGIPYRVVLSEKQLGAGEVEVLNRTTGEVKIVKQTQLIDFLASNLNE
jgi:prolyl-tRNA synthetase